MQDPDSPRDSGKISLPKVDVGMNKISPTDLNDNSNVRPLRAEYQSQQEDEAEVLSRARKRLERCISAEADNRREGLDDDKFYAGDQWSANDRARRNSERRPCLTVNKFPVLVKQVTNDQRQNRPTLDIHPIGDRSDVEVARIYRGLIREIERDSRADRAYDTGFESAVRKGWGYWRVTTEYADPDTFDQIIVCKRIRNAYSVYLDPDSTEIDGSDAKFGFITEMIDRDEFKAQWPDADPMPWVTGGFGDSLKTWIDQYSVRIAEYYETKLEPRELVLLENGFEGWRDELRPEVLQQFKVVDKRRSLVPKITWYKITGRQILEQTVWPGRWIPIVKVIGDEQDIEGRVKLWGIIRQAKDPQRMLNYSRCLAIDTPIPTPDGWKPIGDIVVGDKVFDEKGDICNVKGVSPTHLFHKCFRVTFNCGTSIIADEDHPWAVEERSGRKAAGTIWTDKILTTKELEPDKHFIYTTLPLELPSMEFPIDPYLLGVWLGDGSKNDPIIFSGVSDVDNMRDNLTNLRYRLSSTKYDIRGDNAVCRFTVLGVRHLFTGLGLIVNKKHIPAMYLRGSIQQRWNLLQGLMDTDGTINPRNNQCGFSTTNEKLALDFEELIASLGIRVKIIKEAGEKHNTVNASTGRLYEGSDAYIFLFSCPHDENVFRLKRKATIQNKVRPFQERRSKRHSIVSVESVTSVPVKCISVDSPSHLFLAGRGMIATHNTMETEVTMLVPKSPYLIAEGQLEGYEGVWQESNTKNLSFLPYRAQEIHGHMVPPPQRIPPAQIPAGVVNVAMGAAQDMLATTGVRFDATLQERQYDESGRALRELRRSGDIGSFNYIDNLIHSLRHTGEIYVDLIPKIYTRPGRVVTILRDDDTEEQLQIQPGGQKPVSDIQNSAQAKVTRAFDPTYGRYGVAVTIGPSYATRRIETVESMMDFLRAIPTAAPVIADLVAKNQDWEGAEEIAARLAKTLPPGMIQPEMRDVPPQVQALLAQSQQQIQKLTAERQQLMAQVNDRNADRALARERINRTFETQLLSIVQKANAEAQRVHAEDRRSEAEGLRNLASDVLQLYGDLSKVNLGSDDLKTDGGSPSPSSAPSGPEGRFPPGARQAPDGNYYVPDPTRPGKYLRVMTGGAA